MARTINQEQFRSIIEQAVRAPTVHNTQPAKFKWSAPDVIQIFGDSQRILNVGDPSLRDHFTSIGAVCEGLRLALNQLGFMSSRHHLISSKNDINLESQNHLVAEIRVHNESAGLDPLASFVLSRHAFRGKFAPVETARLDLLKRDLDGNSNVFLLTNKNDIRKVADQYDRANKFFLSSRSYAEELFLWMRFSKKHPQWFKDGLSAEAMALSGIEAVIAGFLMQPQVISPLMRMGIGGLLISESPQINSSSCLLVQYATAEEHPFDTGRDFYRNWLTLAKHHISACPLSALADHEESARFVLDLIKEQKPEWNISKGRLVNVWRCGETPIGRESTSPRLKSEDFIIE